MNFLFITWGLLTKGMFTNNVLDFFDHLSPFVGSFYFIWIWHFWTTYPPLLVNVVCERPLRTEKNGKYLVDVWAEELLAFELNLSCVVGLRTIDVDFASQFNPGDSEDTSGKTTGKRNHILLVMVQEGQLALANIMYCNLKDKKK